MFSSRRQGFRFASELAYHSHIAHSREPVLSEGSLCWALFGRDCKLTSDALTRSALTENTQPSCLPSHLFRRISKTRPLIGTGRRSPGAIDPGVDQFREATGRRRARRSHRSRNDPVGSRDFVYAGESATFQLPFVNLAPRAGIWKQLFASIAFRTFPAELILLGKPFDASRAADLGLVTQVVPDQNLLATATETACSGLKAGRGGAGVQAPDEARFTRTIGAGSET
jgi:hypothetical protein